VSTKLEVERFPNAAAFLAAAETYLSAHEVENALILGVARDLTQRTPAVAPYFACVRDGERIVMCAFQSLPEKAGITRASEPAAFRLLAQDLHDFRPEVREVVGPEPTVRDFTDVLARVRGGTATLRMASRIYVLRRVIPPARPAPGRLRPGRESDLDLACRWLDAFVVEIGDETTPGDLAERWLRAGKVHFWEDGAPVSVAAATGKTANGIRVSFVYTPPEHRGRGYASACVAALSQLLLDQGNEYCCLYTDLANPTSNKIYREIGYEPVCDAASYAIDKERP
jgi:predicted GNAT family acetyltransferase